MELRHVLGRTWVAEASTALLPIYRVTDMDMILIDTGYAKLDRAGLTALIEDNGFHLRGIICSHAHFDHSGNVRYLQQRCGAKAAAHIIEAGISVNPDAYRAIRDTLPETVRADLAYNSAYWDQFRDNAAQKVADKVYDTSLKAYGDEDGIQSYGTVVDLLVTYYKDRI